jgi:hypothetical protein
LAFRICVGHGCLHYPTGGLRSKRAERERIEVARPGASLRSVVSQVSKSRPGAPSHRHANPEADRS